MGTTAENIADVWGITRKEMDEFAASSQQKTEAAQKGLGIADEHDGVWMPGVLSRKKQVAAPIMAAC